jgi:hypothetical protein
MPSHILTFIWVQRRKGNAINVLSHSVVATLSEAEATIVEGVCDWLTERKRENTTNIEPTAATGGDLTDLTSTLKVVADQYGYTQYAEDCPTLAEHGIKRTALAP